VTQWELFLELLTTKKTIVANNENKSVHTQATLLKNKNKTVKVGTYILNFEHIRAKYFSFTSLCLFNNRTKLFKLKACNERDRKDNLQIGGGIIPDAKPSAADESKRPSTNTQRAH
jgi:hypothetical protein